MKYQATAIRFSKSNSLLKRLNIALTVISTIGMGLWAWIQNNPNHLPAPDSSYGKSLLRQYQGLTYDIWLILLLLAVGYLINRSYINKRREAAQATERPQGQRNHSFNHPQEPCHHNPVHQLHSSDDCRHNLPLQRHGGLVPRSD